MACSNCDQDLQRCPCIPAGLLADPQLHAWVADRDLTSIVRLLLDCTRLTQTQVGAVLGGLRQSTISKINAGSLIVQDRRTLQRALARFTPHVPAVRGQQVSAAPEREPLTAPPPQWGDVDALTALDRALAPPNRRTALTLAGAGLVGQVMGWALAASTPPMAHQHGVSDELCDQFADIVDAIRMADAQGGASATLRASVAPQLQMMRQLLSRGGASEAQRHRLLRLTADLTGLAGWMAVDAGDDNAQELLLAGLGLAHDAHDPLLGAGIISYLTVHAYSNGQGEEAALMASTALHRVRGLASPRVQCLLWIRQARGHAAAGDELRARRALDQAYEAFAQGRCADDPGWLYWIDEGELACQGGTVLLQTGHTQQALTQIDQALLGYSPAHVRNQTSAQVRAAKTLVAMGEPGEACARTHLALDRLEGLNSARTEQQIRDLLDLLSPYRGHTDVTEVFGRARTLLEPLP